MRVGLIVVALAATAAEAAQPSGPIDVRAGRLADALSELAREARIEVLFDEAIVRGQRARPVSGRYTPRQALDLLLAGTGVGYRLSPDGAFVLQPLKTQAPPEREDGAISEVLVVGRKTQNTDIRRTRNDIQPYVVLGARDLALLQFDTIDELAQGRVTANTQAASLAQSQLARTDTNSSINLRGVGQQRTLVLIDGRRLPGLPTANAGFDQGDLNALPLGAIERVETLTATAGGIHGPNALGGVVNFVLRRDYRGADLTVASSLASRGDAARTRIEARLGFTPDRGQTDVMVLGAYAKADPLRSDRRDFLARALRREAALDPAGFLNRGVGADAVIVESLANAPLQFDAAYGGGRLGSNYSFLPLDFAGDDAARRTALASNAGTLPTTPPRGGGGAGTSLLAGSEMGSALFTVRRRLSSRLEAFVDGLYLLNRAEGSVPLATISTSVHADALSNPFNQAVTFTYPASDLSDPRETRLQSHRVTAGLIARLPFRWQGAADFTMGAARRETRRATPQMINLPTYFGYGVPGPGGLPAVFPLGDGPTLLTAAAAYATKVPSETKLSNRFRSLSARAAGPLVELPGGPLTLTVLGEARREHMPEGAETTVYPYGTATYRTPDRVQLVRSAYGELRAPVVPRDAALALVRGLEFQFAVRRDHVRSTFPENVLTDARFKEGTTRISHRADVFTVGARVFPASWAMLRASVATGEAPPTLQQLQEQTVVVDFNISDDARDPRRGNRRISEDGAYLWVRGGNHEIGQEKGETTSVGLVVNPDARAWPRLSIDLSRVEVRDEIIPFTLDFGTLIRAEALYPDRVTREPLSPADAALGYAAGRITRLDFGVINGGRTVTDSLDVQWEWTLPLTPYGQGRLYGAATWQPTFRTRTRLGAAMIERSGYSDGPMPIQGYAGVEWRRGDLSIDLNVQVNDRRHLTAAAGVPVVNAEKVRAYGSDHVPARAYVDLAARRAFDLPVGSLVRGADVVVGVQNLFDTSPPILANTSSAVYDLQGDPRRRRFHLRLSAKF